MITHTNIYKRKFFLSLSIAFFIAVILLECFYLWAAKHPPSPVPGQTIVILSGAEWIARGLQALAFCMTGYGVFFAVYTGIHQPDIANAEKIKASKLKKVEKAFELVQKFDDDHMLEAREYSRSLAKIRSEISDADLINQITEDPSREASVAILFNYAEYIRIAVENDIADKIVLSTPCYPLKGIMERFKPYYFKNSVTLEYREAAEKDFKRMIACLDACIKAHEENPPI